MKNRAITEAGRLPRALRETGKAALRQGWRIRITGGDHLLWQSPNGDRIITARSPSDVRSLRNARSYFRRAGLNV